MRVQGLPWGKYPLLIDLIVLFPIWLFLLFLRRDLVREILITSLVFGICGPLSEILYHSDYWKPQLFNGWSIGIEDFLFGFFIGGIASVIYSVLFRKHLKKKRGGLNYFIVLLTIFIFVTTSSLLFTIGINSIYSTSLAMIITGIFISFKRKDLFVDSVISGICMGFIFLVMYFIFLSFYPDAIHNWWLINNIQEYSSGKYLSKNYCGRLVSV